MADEVDIANDLIIQQMEMRIAAARSAAALPPVDDCQECEDPIEPARKGLNLRLCFECANAREKAAKAFARG